MQKKERKKAKRRAAEAKTIQFLEAEFPKRAKLSRKDEIKVLKVEKRTHSGLDKCAKQLGLVCSIFWDDFDWVDFAVIARKKSVLDKKIAELKQEEQDNFRKRKRDLELEQEAVEEAARNKRQKVLDDAQKNKYWDVTGSWEISCPEAEAHCGELCEEMSMEIYCEETDDVHQMYAKFNMGVIEGVFRFERQGKKEDDSSEEESGNDDYDSDR
jgi:hypothetical protein